MSIGPEILFLPLVAVLVIGAVLAAIWLVFRLVVLLGRLIGKLFGLIGALLGRVFQFVRGMLGDSLRLVGGLVTATAFVPLALFNIVMGRWSAANHYGKALEEEVVGVGMAVYRLALGHPSRLLGLTALTERIERRIPEVIARAPGADAPPTGMLREFDGYQVVGSLPSGGSGGRLYLAEPKKSKRAELAQAGRVVPDRVVIKSFSLHEGSTLSQILRENRALQAARDVGLVLEHETSPHRFFYVMPYVAGEDLSAVTRRMHDRAGGEGLDEKGLRLVLGMTADVLRTLETFHGRGLWHKDIKPGNVIVSPDGRAHLVDLGLVTPLASAMTLTTHGTEYFRDPEMVRLAMQGVKVHEVDGVRFDVYSVGALLFSLVEGSFPAHGNLSRITKRCPESLRWIVHRAMADMGKRYGSAREMLLDLAAVMSAKDPFELKLAALPSVGGQTGGVVSEAVAAAAASSESANVPQARPTGRRSLFGRRRAAAAAAVASPLRATAGTAAAPANAEAPSKQRSPSRQRSKGPGVRVGVLLAIAAGFVFFLLPFLGFMAATGARMSQRVVHRFEVPVEPSSPAGAQSSHTGRAYGREHQELARAVALVERRALRAGASEMLPDDSSFRSSSNGDVLILNDMPAGIDARSLQEIQRVLGQGRFQVIGLGQDPAREEQEIELLANARNALGASDVLGDDPEERLRFFLQGEEDLDAILWIRPGDEPSEVERRVIYRRDASLELVPLLQLVR